MPERGEAQRHIPKEPPPRIVDQHELRREFYERNGLTLPEPDYTPAYIPPPPIPINRRRRPHLAGDVPVALIAAIVSDTLERGHKTKGEICRTLGWTIKAGAQADQGRLNRALGLRGTKKRRADGSVINQVAQRMRLKTARAIIAACDRDPEDYDLANYK